MQGKSINDELDDIRKFAVYRTANKLNSLQETLKTIYIPYKLFLSVLDIYSIDKQEINEEKLENVIHDTFFAATKQGYLTNSVDYDTETSTKSLTDFLLGIFNLFAKTAEFQKKELEARLEVKGNPNYEEILHRHQELLCNNIHTKADRFIRLYDLKLTLLMLCTVSNQPDLIYEHFLINCDHNRCVTRFRLKGMLDAISTILMHIDSEFDMDDWHRCNIIDEWFAQCPGIVGLNEYQFTSFWVGSKSIFRNYAQLMAISQRIMETKDIEHDIDCFVCKTVIKGLRIECTICSNRSFCFKCFSVDTNVNNHAISHGLDEYHLLNKCGLFFKKCWNIMNCRNDNVQSLEIATIKTNFVEFRHEFTTIINRNAPTQDDVLSRTNSYHFDGKLPSIIKLILTENEKLRLHLDDLENLGKNEPSQRIIRSHLEVLKIIIRQLEEHTIRPISNAPISSTPYCKSSKILTQPIPTDSYLSKSLKGAEINKSFLEQNNSNLSVSDVSTWLHTKRLSSITRDRKENLATVCEDTTNIDTDMQNFKELLHIVKDIIEDTYSDNMELSKATNQLEYVLDSIIEGEEKKRLGR